MNVFIKKCTPLFLNCSCYSKLENLCKLVATYKSGISLEELYPSSNLKLTTPDKPSNNAPNTKFSGYIPIDKIEITYSKSTGPGGQNVNKVNTKVDLRFHLESANWLHEDTKKAMERNLKTKITNGGFLIFRSDITRSQQLNLADCLDKLRRAIYRAIEPEPIQTVETAERLRRRYEREMEIRLLRKRERSQIKENRRDLSIHNLN